jgi:hypothetical protein
MTKGTDGMTTWVKDGTVTTESPDGMTFTTISPDGTKKVSDYDHGKETITYPGGRHTERELYRTDAEESQEPRDAGADDSSGT